MNKVNHEKEQLVTHLHRKNQAAFRLLVEEMHPYDLEQMFLQLNEFERRRFLYFLEAEEIATLLEECDRNTQRKIINSLGNQHAAKILQRMSRDDVVDLLGGMKKAEQTNLLTQMEQLEAAKVRALLDYPEESAGGLMTDEFVNVHPEASVQDVIHLLRHKAVESETIYYLYVTKPDGTLVGVLSLRELILAEPEQSIEEIMVERVVSVPVDMDQEEVARIMSRYHFLALPVVGHAHRLLGIVTVDDIIDVLIQEAEEDIQQLSGLTPGADDQAISFWRSAQKRIPWLVLLLAIGLATANLINLFQSTIAAVPALTSFMPMVAGMTGNAATQSLALMIRRLPHEQTEPSFLKSMLRQEGLAGLIVSLVCSFLFILMVSLTLHQPRLGLVIGGSLFFTLLLGTMIGTLIPLVLYRLNIDPTAASGPLITTLNDILSLLIYFGLATVFLKQLTQS
ncbi:magnesium transporter [Laceyella putida]|uniref:Magnesium transporter MgtE n=1 Tax=Laceyella putida TaxID=110101 RepID=A0ABW2RK43_9BACL